MPVCQCEFPRRSSSACFKVSSLQWRLSEINCCPLRTLPLLQAMCGSLCRRHRMQPRSHPTRARRAQFHGGVAEDHRRLPDQLPGRVPGVASPRQVPLAGAHGVEQSTMTPLSLAPWRTRQVLHAGANGMNISMAPPPCYRVADTTEDDRSGPQPQSIAWSRRSAVECAAAATGLVPFAICNRRNMRRAAFCQADKPASLLRFACGTAVLNRRPYGSQPDPAADMRKSMLAQLLLAAASCQGVQLDLGSGSFGVTAVCLRMCPQNKLSAPSPLVEPCSAGQITNCKCSGCARVEVPLHRMVHVDRQTLIVAN